MASVVGPSKFVKNQVVSINPSTVHAKSKLWYEPN
ncbi:hypothetical protein COLO4_25702 [Corchorus olitorius]|uniref:Uncharacterized protein n=1 Tax=Corchorus olitorius TaxID=93759 RepID=A0A1R3I0D6_9ROSI|nr:hypothetical protein COLO4_25702 [Corchorus olitorius]